MRILVLLMAVTGLMSCGKKGRSSGVQFKIIPDQPIIIAADRVRGDITDKGPWYQYGIQATNNDESSAVTIAVIKVTITGVDENNVIQTKTASHSAGELNTAATETLAECKYTYYSPLPAGGTPTVISVDKVAQNCGGQVLFIDTDGPGGQNLTSYSYNVKLQFLGWFGSASEPEERFETTMTFSAH